MSASIRIRRFTVVTTTCLASLVILGMFAELTSAQDGLNIADAIASPEGFLPGEATATANSVVLGLSPGGGKPIDISLGKSIARYQNRTATSEGAALNLGLLEVFFSESAGCEGAPPILPDDQLPPISASNSGRPTGPTPPLEVRAPGETGNPGGVLGTQTALAQPSPQHSYAATTTVSQDFGIMGLDGAATSVHTTLNGGVREAVATTTGTRLWVLGGLLSIYDPTWTATARSGAIQELSGEFTFSSVEYFGLSRTAAEFNGDFTDLANGMEGLLSGLGVRLTQPEVIIDEEFGSVEVTPLVFGLKDPPIGLDLIQPLLQAFAPQIDQSRADLIAEDCNNQGRLQIADLALGVLSGSGSIDLSFGGVEAFTAATDFPEPAPLDFGQLGSSGGGAALTFPNSTDFGSSASNGSFSTPSFDTSGGVQPLVAQLPGNGADAGVAQGALNAEVLGAAVDRTDAGKADYELPIANLVTRRFEEGQTGGPAVAVGGLGLVAIAALTLGDRFVLKRTKKEIPG